MKRVGSRNFLGRVAGTVTLLAAPLGVIDRAEAACTPPTTVATPANNTTVTCTGTTTDQNADNVTTFAGYGTGSETGIVVNVETGASVTSSSNTPLTAGINISSGTVNNLGAVTVAGIQGTGVFGLGNITVINSGSINFDTAGHGNRGILSNSGTATVTNNAGGHIFGNLFGIDGQTVNVANTGLIEAAQPSGIAINAADAATVSNSGTIRSNGANGIAISAGTADVSNAGGIQASSIAITTQGLLTLNNFATGVIASNGFQAVISQNGAVDVTNAGTIQGGAASTAIFAATDATVNNTATGHITGGNRAINGNNTSVINGGTIEASGAATIGGNTITLDNSGLIRANAAVGVISAVEAVNNVTVTKNSGTIESNADNTNAIKSTTADISLNNLSGGLIQANGAGAFAVNAATSATVANAGTIEASGAGGIAIMGTISANVANAGIVQAMGNSGIAISGTNVNVDNTGIVQAMGSNGNAIQAINGTATVNNSGDGISTGIITANNNAIFATNAINVTNTGLIQASANGGETIRSLGDVTVNNFGLIENFGGTGIHAVNGTADVTNTGTIRSAGLNGFAIVTHGTATINNTGDGITTGVISAGSNAIASSGDVKVTANTGLIEARDDGRDAIFAAGTADITNAGKIQTKGVSGGTAIFARTVIVDNRIGGTISGGFGGIFANGNIDVTANAGIIESTGAIAEAINTSGTAKVNNTSTGKIRSNAVQTISASVVDVTNAGTIEATGTGSQAILGGNAIVNNMSGGTISGVASGIRAAVTADVTNAAGATISGGIDGINAGSGTVTNAGTISGGTNSVKFIGTGTNKLTLLTGSVLIGDAVGSTLAGATNNLILQGSGTVDNHFTGFNTLDVNASGAWVWNSNSAIDATTVNSGTLVVDNVLASPVTVNSGGTLAGQGLISGDISVASGAIVAPGATVPFSTLNVSGNVSFQPGSIFRVNADATGKNDKLAVTGSATLTGGTVNVLAGGSFAPSSLATYKILTTTNVNGLGGTTFSSVTTNLAFLTPSLSYTANDVTLTLATATGGTGDPGGGSTGGGTTGGGTASTGFGFASVAQTRNQRAVATALDRGPVSNPLIIAVLNQTVAGARQAFDALSGEVFGSVHNAQGQEAQFARSAMLGRMRQSSYAGIPGDLGALGFGGPALAYAAGDTGSTDSASAAYATKAAPGARGPSRDLTFWAQGLGGWGHADSDGNAASLRSRFGGFLSGVDARVGETWRAGFVAGYMRSDLNVNARASSAGIDSVQLGGYAAGRLGVFNVRGGGSYSLDSIDTSRAIFFPGFSDKASARFHGNVGQVFGEVGYGMAFGSVAVEPLAGLAYVHVRDGSFLESGGVAALSGASASENFGYSSLGVRAATAVPLADGTMLVPRATLQWQHAFGDVVPASALAFQGTGAAFSVAGLPIARNTALVEGGFDWRFAPQAKLGAFYQGELAAHAQTHAVKGAFTWDF
jgi:outer membrane autotransporter protein